MTRKYTVEGYLAFSEQDSFENGCIGPTFSESLTGKEFVRSSTSLVNLISELCAQLCADSDAVTVNSCDEMGRVDIQVVQRSKFHTHRVSQRTMEEWRAGKRDLWLTTYILW